MTHTKTDLQQIREALHNYILAQSRMCDRWSECDEKGKNFLWRNLHACEDAGRDALAALDRLEQVDEKNYNLSLVYATIADTLIKMNATRDGNVSTITNEILKAIRSFLRSPEKAAHEGTVRHFYEYVDAKPDSTNTAKVLHGTKADERAAFEKWARENIDHYFEPGSPWLRDYNALDADEDGAPVYQKSLTQSFYECWQARAAQEEGVSAIKVISEYPITDPNNMDAMNMRNIAIEAQKGKADE